MRRPRPRRPAWRCRLTLLGCILLAIACGGTGTRQSGGDRPALATGTAEPPTAGFRVETVATGLEAPWEIAFLPDGRIFVTERPGRVRVMQDGELTPDPVATIDEVAARGEGGLLGMALHPDFQRNHWLYLYFTSGSEGGLENRVVRYTEASNQLTEPVTIIDGIPAAGIHDGGRIAFGPDGKLYITTGDAAQSDLAQDRSSLAGKILRLNPDGSIPSDNPFPGSPVLSYGHRNPEGLAWQPGTNQLFATEHGPGGHDEVNIIHPGANYGWPEMQGNAGHPDGFTPLIESGDDTWAPTGATFVQGDAFPQWQGNLLFASLRGRTLWRLDLRAVNATPALEPVLTGYGRLRAVVQGPDGMLYVLTSNRDGRGSPTDQDDRVLRLVPASTP